MSSLVLIGGFLFVVMVSHSLVAIVLSEALANVMAVELMVESALQVSERQKELL